MKILEEEPPLADECKLPWLIDAFLYPISASGMIHLAVFVIVPLLIIGLIRFIEYFLEQYLWLFTAEITEPVAFILNVIFYSYVCYYIADCVISSSKGNRRAAEVSIPNTIYRRFYFPGIYYYWLCSDMFSTGFAIFGPG